MSALQEQNKLKKIQDEIELKKKEEKMIKLKEDMGVLNVGSRIHEETQAFRAKQKEKQEKNDMRRSMSQENSWKYKIVYFFL